MTTPTNESLLMLIRDAEQEAAPLAGKPSLVQQVAELTAALDQAKADLAQANTAREAIQAKLDNAIVLAEEASARLTALVGGLKQ